MPLSLVRFDTGEGARWGVLTGKLPGEPDDVVEVAELDGALRTTADVVAAVEPRAPPKGEPRRFAASHLLSPVTRDARLVCQGLNYGAHAAEAGHGERKQNLFFAKASSSLCGPYDDIVRPPGVQLLDYEVELGIVLRRPLRADTRVTAAGIGEHVAGVVLCNDVSARDSMFGASFLQWFEGKSHRTFCPCGPVLLLAAPEETAALLESLELSLELNGEPRQRARTSELIYKPVETLEQLALLLDLDAGDVVLTGTPGGVIARGTPALIDILARHLLDDARRREAMVAELTASSRFLQPGDRLRLDLRHASDGTSYGGQASRVDEGTEPGR